MHYIKDVIPKFPQNPPNDVLDAIMSSKMNNKGIVSNVLSLISESNCPSLPDEVPSVRCINTKNNWQTGTRYLKSQTVTEAG